MAVLTEINWRDGIDVEYPHVQTCATPMMTVVAVVVLGECKEVLSESR